MNRLMLAAAFGALALGACSDPAPEPEDTLEPTVEQPVAPVEEVAPPTTTTTTAPPSDSTTLPPESRTSEETVKPESETLFY